MHVCMHLKMHVINNKKGKINNIRLKKSSLGALMIDHEMGWVQGFRVRVRALCSMQGLTTVARYTLKKDELVLSSIFFSDE